MGYGRRLDAKLSDTVTRTIVNLSIVDDAYNGSPILTQKLDYAKLFPEELGMLSAKMPYMELSGGFYQKDVFRRKPFGINEEIIKSDFLTLMEEATADGSADEAPI